MSVLRTIRCRLWIVRLGWIFEEYLWFVLLGKKKKKTMQLDIEVKLL